MGIFNWSKEERVEDKSQHFVVGSTVYKLLDAMDGRLLKQVVDELTIRVVEEIYPEVIKRVDKELIVKEVSTRVSDEVIQKLFSHPDTKSEA